jgi:hypothetical protein
MASCGSRGQRAFLAAFIVFAGAGASRRGVGRGGRAESWCTDGL